MKTTNNEVSYEEFLSMNKDEIYHLVYDKILYNLGFGEFVRWAIDRLFEDPKALWEFINMKTPSLTKEEEIELTMSRR